MSVKGLTLQEWDASTERKLSRYVEQSKFLGDVKGIDIESLASDMQGFFNMGGFDIRSFKQSGRVFAKAYSDYKTGLEGILEKFRANIRSGVSIASAKRIALESFRDVCDEASKLAYRAGMLRVGNPADEIGAGGKKIAGAAAGVESGFFGGRLADAINPEMDSIIVAGYSDSLKAQYFNGMIGGADINQKFLWQLGSVKEHCSDCLSLAAGSPYTKLTLPTCPRCGDTECLWNCNCSLVPIGGMASNVGAGLKPGEENLVVSVTSIGSTARPSIEIVKLLDALYSEVNRLRVAFEFAIDAVEKKAIIAQKTALAQTIIDMAQQANVRVVPMWSLGDIQAITSALKTKGYTLIKDFAQLSSGAKIWLLRGTALKTASIKAITRTGITLDVGGRSVTYKSVEDFIGFSKG